MLTSIISIVIWRFHTLTQSGFPSLTTIIIFTFHVRIIVMRNPGWLITLSAFRRFLITDRCKGSHVSLWRSLYHNGCLCHNRNSRFRWEEKKKKKDAGLVEIRRTAWLKERERERERESFGAFEAWCWDKKKAAKTLGYASYFTSCCWRYLPTYLINIFRNPFWRHLRRCEFLDGRTHQAPVYL